MIIRLNNIGIISDSTIEINGLTVITGHNNSGKTTVGKVLYSLVDAVSDLEQKASNDKYNFVLDQLRSAVREFSCRAVMRREAEKIETECIRIFFSEEYGLIPVDGLGGFLIELILELDNFSIEEEPYRSIIDQDFRYVAFEEIYEVEDFLQERERAKNLLQETYNEITRDTELINYARQSINETLSVEFSGQIQPAALKGIISEIEMTDGKKTCFSMELFDNEIVRSDKPVFFWMPYKNTYFIDNPYIVGEPIFRRRTRYTTTRDSYVDEMHILTHENKLKAVINRPMKKTVFEAGVLEERYNAIKERIDAILPGDFVFTNEGQQYVHDGVNLKASNLATGSKMFSIIKLLIANGEVTDKTLLILDEPEAHLHPMWQNIFAEIMVLLAKELRCHIVLTTHSPNFMLALEANMRKYKADDICNFYRTEHIDNSMFVKYKCVNDSLDTIYNDFVTYLSEVKMLRDRYL